MGHRERNHNTTIHLGELHYLGNTKTWAEGATWSGNFPPQFNKQGNPFYHHHSSIDTVIYYSTKAPNLSSDKTSQTGITKADHIYTTCRYNPLKDTGEGNEVYFKYNNYI